MNQPLKFRNKKRKTLHKKELIVFIIIGVLFFSIIYYYYFILYAPVYNSEYPQINITCEEDPNYNNFVDSTFQLKTNDDSENVDPINSRIKIRGSGRGWNELAPKKGYRLELSDPKSLLGMREDDDWLLMAMYSDFPRMRIKLAFDLWRTLQTSNPTAILPRSEYVIVFINGDFQGLYLLVERNDRRLFGLNDEQNNIKSSLIFQAKGTINFKIYQKEKWEQDWPNEYEGIYIMDEILPELISFVAQSSDEDFFNSSSDNIYSKFEKVSLIDFYIFNFFILHKDFWDCNYFIVRNTNPSKFFLIPWDFDKCFGQFAWNTFDSNFNPENNIKESNKLYDRLIGNNLFMEDVKIRWFELRQTIWSEESILDMLTEIYEEIENILDIETEKWNPGDLKEEWKNDVDLSVERLFEWISERLDFCDSYFNEK